jgi:hypothetical protein
LRHRLAARSPWFKLPCAEVGPAGPSAPPLSRPPSR